MQNSDFQIFMWEKGHELYRDMPWREDTRAYYVLVSELMLQQTQVARVIPKFTEFVRTFPDESKLANATLGEVLKSWQGLGYNRRAKFLHESAKVIVNTYCGRFPTAQSDIIKLPGVGVNTMGAIRAYSFNQPSIFVETNIRTVYIHHFFDGEADISDKQIIEKLEATLDHEHPREFYWALMDYGSWLKANGIKNVSQSKHYKKQSALEGSVRQVRGQIIRELKSGELAIDALRNSVLADERFDSALDGLIRDGLIVRSGEIIHLTN